MPRIYLDNAATSWPKPESVYVAVDKFQRNIGASAGRGGYKEVVEAQRLVAKTSNQIARFINADGNRKNIAFTYSCTDALCTGILGLAKDGDHIVTSTAEHNSVLRPLHYLESQRNVQVTRVACDAAGYVDAADIIAAMKPNTRMVVMSHVSNVTGSIQPVETVGAYCRANNVRFLLDAAQSIGHLPIDVQAIGCDMLAAPGHKGLMAPLGTGFFYYTNEVAEELMPLRFGGTGTLGGVDSQPSEIPDKFESGSPNMPGIAGLQAGLKFLATDEARERAAIAHELSGALLAGVQQIEGLRLQGSADDDKRVGVVSVGVEGMYCGTAATELDARWGVQTRAGLHCAPLLHRTLSTEECGGTVRLSVGLFNTRKEIEVALDALEKVAKDGLR